MSRRRERIELELRQKEILEYVFGGVDSRMTPGQAYGPDARKVARGAMGRWRFGLEPDDVIAEALVRMLRRVANDPSPIGNIGGYFRTTCRSVCAEIANGNSRFEMAGADEMLEDRSEPVGDGPTTAEVADILNRLRALTDLLGSDPVTVSGVLTWITLEADQDIDLTGVPVPAAGVPAHERLRWPALWFATGKDALFRSPTAIRRRRQRLIAKIVDLRVLVLAMAGSERS
ncbi:MAG: hypothetical protein ACO225_13865 [Ilumatobacteraceae bacterium]